MSAVQAYMQGYVQADPIRAAHAIVTLIEDNNRLRHALTELLAVAKADRERIEYEWLENETDEPDTYRIHAAAESALTFERPFEPRGMHPPAT